MEKLLIIDVSNLFYRSLYGSQFLSTSAGFPVHGLHGFVKAMNALLKEHNPTYVALAMEGFGPSFRKKIEPLYKANRQELSDEIKSQLNVLPRLIEALGYKTYRANGFEADDIIGTLAVKIANEYPSVSVEIVSSDKDFAQLVTNQIVLLDLMKNKKLGETDIRQKYGVSPNQFVDYLAIVGDSSDNIKGVDGVGPKGASKLLQEYRTLENIYSCVHQIKGATQKKLLASKELAFKAKILAKIDTNVPLEFNLKDAVYKGPDTEKLRKIFRELEFKELEGTMLGSQVQVLSGVAIGVRS